MQSIISLIGTALISGLLATVVTLWWQRRTAILDRKLKAFETLMSYRYMISSAESVKALNSIDIIFYKDDDVRKAYSDFLNEADKNPEFNPNIGDKHLKLLEEMAKALRLKDIHWDEIKHSYYPEGLARKTQEEDMLRRAQLQNAIETKQRNAEQQNTPASNQFGEQLAAQMLPDLLKNPESLKMILEYAKKNNDKQ